MNEHPQQPGTVERILERNIAALLERNKRREQRRSLEQRLADAITAAAGSMKFVYLHVVLFGGWVAINLGAVPALQPFDPTLVMLAMVASVEAIFLMVFVLMTQNKMDALANKRADLDLQISLLAEHEVTRMIELVSAIGEKLQVDVARRAEFSELEQDVRPEVILDRIEDKEQRG